MKAALRRVRSYPEPYKTGTVPPSLAVGRSVKAWSRSKANFPTAQRFGSPSHAIIHRPDVAFKKPYTAGCEQYETELLSRYQHGELLSQDSIKFADSLRYTTPGGKIVYGGGGIMPDVFVPLDTAGTSDYYSGSER